LSNGTSLLAYHFSIPGETYYTWDDGHNDTWIGSRNDLSAGTYEVTISHDFCPDIIDTIVVESLDLSYRQEYYSCSLDSVSLFYESNSTDLNYSWAPGMSFDDSTAAHPIYLPEELNLGDSLTPSLTLTMPAGCNHELEFNLFFEDQCVWPGDSNGDNKVDASDIINIGLSNGSTGNPRTPQESDWFAQPTLYWNSLIPGSNLDESNADCNGDGLINALDTQVVIDNFGLTHFKSHSVSEELKVAEAVLSLDFPSELFSDQRYAIDILLSNEDNNVEDVYGITFKLIFEPNLIQSEVLQINESGWLSSSEEIWNIDFVEQDLGSVEVVMTKTNGQPISGTGKIAELSIQFKESSEDEMITPIVQSPISVNHLGERKTIEVNPVDAILIGTNTSIRDTQNPTDFRIVPNPASNNIQVLGPSEFSSYKIFDAYGRLNKFGILENNNLSIKDLSTGVYYLELQAEIGNATRKFIKI